MLAGPCVIEGEEMALNIAEHVKKVTDRLGIPYVFKGSFKKANRSRLDSFTGIGDEKALKILAKVRAEFGIPVVTDIHTEQDAEMAAECFFRFVAWMMIKGVLLNLSRINHDKNSSRLPSASFSFIS